MIFFIVAKINQDEKLILINLRNGNRYDNNTLFAGKPDKFNLIKDGSVIEIIVSQKEE